MGTIKWFKCKDRLPEERDGEPYKVLVYDNSYKAILTRFNPPYRHWRSPFMDITVGVNPTHWAYIDDGSISWINPEIELPDLRNGECYDVLVDELEYGIGIARFEPYDDYFVDATGTFEPSRWAYINLPE